MKLSSFPFFVCFSILNFETLFCWPEVGMRFQTFYNERKTKCCVVEIHQWLKLWLPPLIYLWLQYSTKQERAKSSTKVNHGNGENQTWNTLLPKQKNNHFGHTDLYVQNNCISTCVWRGLSSSFIITIGKMSAVNNLNKPETHWLFWKDKVYGSK